MTSKIRTGSLLKYIDRFPKKRTLAPRAVVLAPSIWGNVSRISPEAPVPVVNVTKESLLPGGAANVVSNIHALGGNVGICGVIGPDEAGKQLLGILRDKGIQTDGLVVEKGRPTTIKTRIIAHSQQVVRFDRETKNGVERDTRSRIMDFVKQQAMSDGGLDAIVLSDYCKGVITKELVRDIVKLAKQNNIIVSVDPKVTHFGIYKGVTILTPNTREASIGSRMEIEDEKGLIKAGTLLLKTLNCHAVLWRDEELLAEGEVTLENLGSLRPLPPG